MLPHFVLHVFLRPCLHPRIGRVPLHHLPLQRIRLAPQEISFFISASQVKIDRRCCLELFKLEDLLLPERSEGRDAASGRDEDERDIAGRTFRKVKVLRRPEIASNLVASFQTVKKTGTKSASVYIVQT